jgi:hypothetical protein
MPRQGTARRKREREGLPDVKPGRVGWVHGTKLEFMQGFKDDFIKAAELGKVQAGCFYDNVTLEYLKKYGYHTSWDRDLCEGQDIVSDVDEDEDMDDLPTEVSTARSEYTDLFRMVSSLVHWYLMREHS